MKRQKAIRYRLDGSIANSKGFRPSNYHTPIHVKRKKDGQDVLTEDLRASTASNDKKDPSDKFKQRLKLMAEQKARQIQTPELNTDDAEAKDENEVTSSSHKLSVAPKVPSKAPSKEMIEPEPEPEIHREPEPEPEPEIVYPELLLTILRTEWFPKDEVNDFNTWFNPIRYLHLR